VRKSFIVLSENREQLGTGLSCSQFSVFCEKFFYKIMCSQLFPVLGFFTKIIFTIFNKIHLYLILIKSKNRCFAKIVCRFK